MTERSSESRQAEALQQALERHSSLLAEGAERRDARAQISAEVGGEAASLFSLAVGIGDAAAAVPEPQFAADFEARLRRTHVVTQDERDAKERRAERRRWLRSFFQMPQFGFAAAAAAIAIFAGILVPALNSLPGDTLYALKRATETARLGVVTGPREAHLRLRLAGARFEEVEHLVERAQLPKVGPGLAAAGAVQDIKDPRIARLIEETLADAQEQIEKAATILIARPADTRGLDDLVVVSQRGRKLAAEVAEDLPARVKKPVLGNVVRFAKIEAQAKAARMMAEPETTVPPCATPAPTPTPTTSSAAPSSATPTASPTTNPQATPCVSPEPTATPTPTPTPTATPEPASASGTTPTPSSNAGQQGGMGGERSSAERSWRTPRPASTSEPTGA
jgi:hypothetical protein